MILFYDQYFTIWAGEYSFKLDSYKVMVLLLINESIFYLFQFLEALERFNDARFAVIIYKQ